jgi:uncharacterized Zn-binding protein involved in type VI secretion
MPRVARMLTDRANSDFVDSGSNSHVRANGELVVVLGSNLINGATMIEGSSTVRINGVPVCREGDLSSFFDPVTGSTNTNVG